MNRTKTFFGILAIALMATAVYGSTVWAAGAMGGVNRQSRGLKAQPTTEQIALWQAQDKAIQDALASGNYDAWVAAVKARKASEPVMTAQQFAAQVKRDADRKAKADAVNAALVAGDYNSWVTAETTINPNSPLLAKITAANFPRLREAINLRQQADAIMKELGLSTGNGDGLGIRGSGMEGAGFGQEGPKKTWH